MRTNEQHIALVIQCRGWFRSLSSQCLHYRWKLDAADDDLPARLSLSNRQREIRRRFEIIDEVLRGETIFDGIVIGQNDSRIAANLKSAVADINLSWFGNHLYVWRLAARRGRAQGKRAHNHRAQHESSC